VAALQLAGHGHWPLALGCGALLLVLLLLGSRDLPAAELQRPAGRTEQEGLRQMVPRLGSS
jgi:hypothetical protein